MRAGLLGVEVGSRFQIDIKLARVNALDQHAWYNKQISLSSVSTTNQPRTNPVSPLDELSDSTMKKSDLYRSHLETNTASLLFQREQQTWQLAGDKLEGLSGKTE